MHWEIWDIMFDYYTLNCFSDQIKKSRKPDWSTFRNPKLTFFWKCEELSYDYDDKNLDKCIDKGN